ncbi:MAG: hypothetical protein KCHDKBKB_02401 [Elusimicrobia bacterium]|nr:hypothetical protein [Elusimicrobiota bacterium]
MLPLMSKIISSNTVKESGAVVRSKARPSIKIWAIFFWSTDFPEICRPSFPSVINDSKYGAHLFFNVATNGIAACRNSTQCSAHSGDILRRSAHSPGVLPILGFPPETAGVFAKAFKSDNKPSSMIFRSTSGEEPSGVSAGPGKISPGGVRMFPKIFDNCDRVAAKSSALDPTSCALDSISPDSRSMP